MPREQRTNLKKTAVQETELGVFASKPSGAVNMPFVEPTKSKGQALAEGLSMAMKGAALIGQGKIDENSKRTAVLQRYEGMSAARAEALRIFDDLSDRGVTQDNYGAELSKSMRNSMELLKGKGQVNVSYLDGFSSVLGSKLGTKQDEVFKGLMANKLEKKHEIIRQGIKIDLFTNNMDPLTSYKNMQAALNVGNSEAGTFYVTNVAALIDQMADADPNFDWQGAIDKYLKITPEKGVVFVDHPEYGKEIDKLEKELKIQSKANFTNAKNIRAENKVTVESQLLEMSINGSPIKDQIKYLQANHKTAGYSSKEYNAAITSIKKFGDTAYAASGNPKAVQFLKEAITDGNYTPLMLETHLGDLSKEDYNSVVTFKLTHDRAMKTEQGSQSKKYFTSQVATGKKVIGKMGLMGFNKKGAAHQKSFVFEMNSRLQSFLTKQGWDELDVDTIAKWSKESNDIALGVDTSGSTGNNITFKDGKYYNSNGIQVEDPNLVDATSASAWSQ